MKRKLFVTFNAWTKPTSMLSMKASVLLGETVIVPAEREQLDGVLSLVHNAEGKKVSRRLSEIFSPITKSQRAQIFSTPTDSKHEALLGSYMERYMNLIETQVWKLPRHSVSKALSTGAAYHAALVTNALCNSLDIAEEYTKDVLCSPTESFMLDQLPLNGVAKKKASEQTTILFQKLLPNFELLPWLAFLNLRDNQFLKRFVLWLNERRNDIIQGEYTPTDFLNEVYRTAIRFTDDHKPDSTAFSVLRGLASNVPGLPANPVSLILSVDDVRKTVLTRSREGWLFFAIDLVRKYGRLLVLNKTTGTVHHVDCRYSMSDKCVVLNGMMKRQNMNFCKLCLPAFQAFIGEN